MALEDLTGTKYIDDLNSSNPAAGDNVSEGDDHIRGIKNVLKTTFPNIDGAVNATDTELNYVDGVTSAIQTQLGAKLPLAGGTMTGDLIINQTVADSAAIDYLVDIAGTRTTNAVAGQGVGLRFKIPSWKDALQTYVGAGIGAVRESGNDDDVSTALTFSTSQDDATLDEFMRIDSIGNVGIGDTDPSEAKLSIDNIASGDYGLKIVQAQDKEGLYISQTGDNRGLYITSTSSTYYAAEIFGKSGLTCYSNASGGRAAYFYRNLEEAGSYPLVYMREYNTSNTQPALKIQQDGAGEGLYIDQNGNENAILIDSEANSNAIEVNCRYGLYIAQDISDGRAAYFVRNLNETGALPLVNIIDNHASNTQPALKITQAGTGDAARFESAGSTNIVAKSTNGNGGYYNFQGLASNGTQTFGVNHNGTIYTTSNLVFSTAGAGIDFSATSGTGTSEVLDDYEEGTWTPAVWGGGTITTATGVYTRIGRVVHAAYYISYGTSSNNDAGGFQGLPFSTIVNNAARDGYISYSDHGSYFYAQPLDDSTRVVFFDLSGGTLVNSNFSDEIVYGCVQYHI